MRNPRTSDAGAARELVDHHGDVLTIPPASDLPAALRHRRAASWRCVPLGCGRRDPLDDRNEPEITDRELASWRAAWRHLHLLNLPAIIPRRVVAAGRAGPREAA
jgi:hypothetical protein